MLHPLLPTVLNERQAEKSPAKFALSADVNDEQLLAFDPRKLMLEMMLR